MIKAVIFDMFETLVTHFNSPLFKGKEIADEIGIPEKDFRIIWDATDEDRTLGLKTFEDVIEEILLTNGVYSLELYERIIEKRYKAISEIFKNKHSEIKDMLTFLKENGIKIGLITNCYIEEMKTIQASDIYDFFDVTCMSCDVGLKKPDYEIFRKCVSELGLKENECLYVGDGGSGELEAANDVGMHTVQATWYLRDELDQPSRKKIGFIHIESPMELIKSLSFAN